MNISEQLEKFYSILDVKPVSANAIALYTVLLQIAKLSNSFDSFKVRNQILTSKIKNLSDSALLRARNELIQNGYITYKKRNKSDGYI